MIHSQNLILFLLPLLLSCSSGDNVSKEKSNGPSLTTDTTQTIKTTTQPDQEFEKTWTAFANAVSSGDLKALTELSTGCIYCTDCLINTSNEDSLFNIFQKKNARTWYAKKYSEFCYIPIDKFLSED